jgi:serine/threonine protein kinase
LLGSGAGTGEREDRVWVFWCVTIQSSSCVKFYDLPKAITGSVYHRINIVSKQDVAIKLEAIDVKHSHVEHEYQLYRSLAGGIGIPSVYWFGSECDYNVMVLEHLRPSLRDLFDRCNRKFTLKTVLLLADQLVSVQNCIG